MARHPARPEVGRIVEITRGRDRGAITVVVGHESTRFVLVADGGKRRVEQPKKKNALHVRATTRVFSDVIPSLAEERKLTNAQLRHILTQYQRILDTVEGPEQGGEQNGKG